MNDSESKETSADPPSEGSQLNEQFIRLREQLRRSRARQFGLGGMLLLTALIAAGQAWLRQSGRTGASLAVFLIFFLGLAVSVTGGIMILESGRQKLANNHRLSGMFLRYGIACLVIGLPAGILLAVGLAYLAAV